MKRRLALAIGSLALGWIGSPALADDPIMAKPRPVTVAMAPAPELTAAEPLHVPELAAAPEAAPQPKTAPAGTPTAIVPYHAESGPLCDEQGHGHKHGGGALSFGLGVYYLQPHYETNPAFTISTIAADNTLQVRQNDFDYDYEFAPLVWVGWSNCDGFGVRGRYWWYENDASTLVTGDGASAFDSAAPLGLQISSTNLGDTLLYATDLRIKVYDVEATQSWNAGGWGVLLAGGVRYAHISQSYVHVGVVGPGIPPPPPPPPPQDIGPQGGPVIIPGSVNAISSGSTFKGYGPTVALEVRRELGGSGLAVYGSARGSLLFGNSFQDSALVLTNVPVAFASTSRDDVMPITELEIGAEFGRSMGRSRFFAQVALVGQVWHGAGNGAQNEMIPVLVDPEVSDNSSNLSLFGGRVSVGINY